MHNKESYPVREFESLKSNPLIDEWLLLGPFVTKTGETFEREYLFERDKILDIDYLVNSGGETSIHPHEGLEQENTFLGKSTLHWFRKKSENIGFGQLTGDILYKTVQRNAVWYAATYIKSNTQFYAFIEFSHSGAKMWVNGKETLNQPYGRTKGLILKQKGTFVKFETGLNIILVKIRPGYIADGVDFFFSNFCVHPSFLNYNNIYISYPRKLSLFFGPLSSPKQVFEVSITKTEDTKEPLVIGLENMSTKKSEIIKLKDLSINEIKTLKIGLPINEIDSNEKIKAKLFLKLENNKEEVSAEFPYIQDKIPTEEGTGFVYTGFHFDTTYHEEQRVYAMGAFDICRSYMRQFRQDPNFKGILSEIDYLKPYFDIFPEDRETMIKAFKDGRAEANVFYNQPNEVSISGEGLVRNLIYGQLFHGKVLGRKCLIYDPGDVFGHPAQLSQIAAKGGCKGIGWDKYILGFPPLFWHISPDGTMLLHRRGNVSYEEAHQMGISSYLTQVDKSFPTEWLKKLTPKIKLALPSDFRQAVKEENSQKDNFFQFTSRDMSLYHAGTALSRINLKIANRIGENLLISAEKFATIAALLGAEYPDKPLDKAWRQLLCNQHHDSITGTHNEISYVDLMIAYRESLELAYGVLNDSLKYINKAANLKIIGQEIPIRIFNSLSWDRKDICYVRVNFPNEWFSFEIRDSSGKNISYQIISEEKNKDGSFKSCHLAFVGYIPSMGYSTYYVKKSSFKENAIIKRKVSFKNKKSIENEYYRIEVDPNLGGGLTSIFDKKAEREVLDLSKNIPGNEISILKENPNRMEPPHEFYTTGQGLFSRNFPAKISVEEGPIIKKIIVKNKLMDICNIRQEIILINGVPKIDFKTYIIDYQDEDDLFTVTFPTNIKGAIPTFDDRYCSVVKRESKGKLDFRTHQMFMFSGCAVYSAYQWIEYGPSVIISFEENGKIVSESSIGMTGLVIPQDKEMRAISRKLLKALTKKGIPVTPWSDTKEKPIGSMLENMNDDLLYIDFRIVLGTIEKPNQYAKKLLAKLSPEKRKLFENKVCKEGRAILFGIDDENDEKKKIKVLIIIARTSEELNSCIDKIEEFLSSGERIKLSNVFLEAKREKVDDYGVTLINTGNIACSVENKGILTLLLFHTAHWYGGTGNIGEKYFVPEQKTHVFNYSLYPHSGDWRKAKSYQKGFEVNNPLISLPIETLNNNKEYILPEKASFLKISPANLIVTALKARGNPLASLEGKFPELPSRGITVRFYEAEGKKAQGKIEFINPLKKCFKTNLLEEKEEEIKTQKNFILYSTGPFSIETISVFLPGFKKKFPAESLGLQAEPVQPIFIRSWEHDAGTMPMGYEAVLASIDRNIEILENGKKLKLKINIVNDYINIPVSGQAKLLIPEGWKSEKTQFPFSITPLGYITYTTIIEKPKFNSKGQIKLKFTHNGQEFQDVLEIGSVIIPEFALQKTKDKIIAAIKNPGEESIEGEIAIASPIETWPENCVGSYSLLEISPRTIGFSLLPKEKRDFQFSIRRDKNYIQTSWWAVAKFMINGRIYLKKVEEKGPSHLWNRRKMFEAIKEGKRRLKS